MKILKEVNIEKKHKCKYCKSIFTYEQKDVDRIFYNRIMCPVCRQLISISIFDKKIRRTK